MQTEPNQQVKYCSNSDESLFKNNLLRLIVDQINDAVWVINDELEIIYINRAAEIILNAHKSINIEYAIDVFIGNDYSSDFKKAVKNLYKSNVIHNSSFQNWRISFNDILETNIQLITDTSTLKKYVLAVTKDVTKAELRRSRYLFHDSSNDFVGLSVLNTNNNGEKQKQTFQELNITDLIRLDNLQQIQDAFAQATGVASVITNPEGIPITKPSNFTSVCKLVRSSEKGLKNCMMSDKQIGIKTGLLRKPGYEKCKSCGFIDAAAPIIVGNQQIAIWMIGQANLGGVTEDDLVDYAKDIGVDENKLISEYKKMKNMSLNQFERIINLVWIFAQELSELAYSNLFLLKKIEEQKKFEQSIKQAKEKAEESDRLKTAFLKNISHEIRTPLNGILGYSELLTATEHSAEEKAQYLKVIENSSIQLVDIIEDIVSMSSIDSKQEKINNTRFFLFDFFEALRLSHFDLINKKGLSFTSNVAVEKNMVFINTDKTKLTQIFNNLIANSLKFTNKGGISIGCYYDDASIIFYVKDTGIGIDDKYKKKVFKRFWRDNSSLNNGGMGLGLSIVKGYIKLLNGHKWIVSEKDKGTQFYFSIPFSSLGI
ncbi:MAG: PocR ligand-binding domain-containing protein [Marinilabiliaceae bacterium]|nr:PocR ligand-binding domain-containing protein [Marinilabiliaceae bacterium]